MRVYRLAHPNFAHDLSGTGARLKGGRWNPKGIPMLYTSESVSLALLEVMANSVLPEELGRIQLVALQIPDAAPIHVIDPKKLKRGWYHDIDYTQWMGAAILQQQNPLVIQCPSVIITSEHNYLLNPLHPQFHTVTCTDVQDFRFDERLFKSMHR
ncbi:MAG: RES family NAD+ phosphorylase [Chitinophagaceae bacterium]|jgi:RES domain-containing protein|nr:RES family NAD+ phosphorylase [Chitinophagaceae bacterium]